MVHPNSLRVLYTAGNVWALEGDHVTLVAALSLEGQGSVVALLPGPVAVVGSHLVGENGTTPLPFAPSGAQALEVHRWWFWDDTQGLLTDENGHSLWTTPHGGPAITMANTVIIAQGKTALGLNEKTGRVRWIRHLPAQAVGLPLALPKLDAVALADQGHEVQVLRIRNGDRVSRLLLPGRPTGPTLLRDGRLAVVVPRLAKIFLWDPPSPSLAVQWHPKILDVRLKNWPVVNGLGRLWVVGSQPGATPTLWGLTPPPRQHDS